MRFAAWTLPQLLSLVALSLGVLSFVSGCASTPLTAQRLGSPELRSADYDAEAIAHCGERMEHCFASIQALQVKERRHAKFLLPRDQDLLERSLAEYLFYRNELDQIARRHSSRDLQEVALRTKTQHDLHFATLADQDPVLWRALNQSFYRSDIPRGSCDRILHELTASAAAPLPGDAQEQVNDVIRRRGLLLPTVENELWHAQPVELLLTSSRTISDQLQYGKNQVVTRTGRLKNPMARPIAISAEQQQQIRAALKPGDILLTYASGFVVNLVIPGNFKHAVTFVGTDAERRAAGLPPEMLLAIPGPNQQRLARTLKQATIEGGHSADAVEAVAEGVRLINFSKTIDARVNRLIVLRPRLSHAERAEQLRDVLSYVGDDFDFSFDLTDASDQVCTEVVYRSLQGRGGIELPLSEHAGRLTLPPDDIMRCCLPSGGNRFECILLVEEAPEAAPAARILYAAEAQAWVARALAPSAPAPAVATRASR